MVTLPIESLRRIESICTEFEHASAEAFQPIAPRLDQVSREERSALLTELIAIDVELRLGRGETPEINDYLALGEICDPPLTESSIRDILNDATGGAAPRPQSSRYEFITKIGSGGNGDVWRVFDRVSRRTLAVKFLRERHRGDKTAEQRLIREALLTGSLQHPGIPPIYEHGRLDDGTHFFSMKLVGGETFANILKQREDDEFNDDNRLSRHLGIFEQLAQTVAYGHAQGVIHRDLKPHNVMVGDFGEVQVMDWGMAKRTSSDDEGSSDDWPRHDADAVPQSTVETLSRSADDSVENLNQTLTAAGDILGTPAYMSPEQARGEVKSLDARSDVFALGAILFEILTGRRLHEGKSVGESMLRTAKGLFEEATVILQSSHSHVDLRTLCETCLQTDPEKRPPDAGVIASTVTDYLAGAERRARRTELEQREAQVRAAEDRKRRRLQTRMACLVAAVSLIGAMIAVWQWRIATDANAKTAEALTLADQRFEQAQTVVDEFFTDVADNQGVLATVPGAQTVRQEMLHKARDYYEDFLAQAGDDPKLQFKVAQAYGRLGEIERIVDPGGEDLIRYRNEVIAVCDRLLKNDPTNLDYIRLRAEAFQAIGSAHGFATRHEPAKTSFQEAKRNYQTLVTLRGSHRDHLDLAKINQNLGRTTYELKQYDESQQLLEAALARADAILDQFGREPDVLIHVRDIYRSMGILKGWGRHDWEGCYDYFTKALEFSKRASELQPQRFDYLDHVATDQMNLAMSCNHVAKHDAAVDYFEQCIETRKQLVAENPTATVYREDLAQVCANFATYSYWRKRFDLSIEMAGTAYKLYDEMVELQPRVDTFRFEAHRSHKVHASLQILADLANGVSRSQAFANAQPDIQAIGVRLARYRDLTGDPDDAVQFAYNACFQNDQPPQPLLDWTDFIDADPAKIADFGEFTIQTRALVYVRNGRHDDAVKLLNAYKNDFKAMEPRFIECLARFPSDPAETVIRFEKAKQQWTAKNNYFYDAQMLHDEVEELIRQHANETNANLDQDQPDEASKTRDAS